MRLAIVLMCLTVSAASVGWVAAAEQTRDADFTITVTNGLLTLQIEQAPPTQVLEAIGKEAGFQAAISGDLGAAQPQSFVDLSLHKGLRRLIGGHSVLMAFDVDAAGIGHIRKVRVQVAGPEIERPTQARRALAEVGAVPPSYQELSSLGKNRRLEAIRDLARVRDEAGVELLAEVVARDADATVRRIATAALSNIGGDDAGQALSVALDDQDRSVRLQALRGLRLIHGEEVAPLLGEVVARDEDPAVRRAAVELAGALRSYAAREVLEVALSDSEPSVREAAEAALVR